MPHKTQVIVNPESNKGRTRRRWSEIKSALRGFFKEFRYDFTEKPFQAADMAREAIKSGSDLIIGVGGDGTMNEIANGFFEKGRVINPDSALGVVPSGTGCDFTKSLNLPSDVKSALKVIAGSDRKKIDVGRAAYTAPSGRTEQRFFLNVADFGFGGEVVREVNRKRLERRASSYFRCLYTTALTYRNKRLKLKMDGRELPAGDYMIGAVANGRIFGKGMKISPRAELDDGLLDFVLVRGMKIMEFLLHSWRIYLGTHLSHPKIDFYRSRVVEAEPENRDDDVAIEIDGEQVGRLPAVFEVLPLSMSVKG
ncbi:MAG: diacylglycerol kinase family lipid kinase [Candidatus Aminicenantes bacterium]|nr:diacylglycerol kinase family lipid kinase [Candidatus Aminicenantes bacterium]